MKKLLGLVLFAVVLAACGSGEDTAAGDGVDLPDGDWALVDGMPGVADYPITLSISGTEASGRAACNSYFGTVSVSGSNISFGAMGQTAMGCEPAVMEAEQTFLAALSGVETFAFNDDRLTLTGSGARLGFDPVRPIPTSALVDTKWELDTLIEGKAASSVSGDPATLVLHADGALTATTGCRTLTGRWIDNGGVIVVPELAADGECPDDLWKQDSLVVTVLEDEFRAEVDSDKLTLTSMGGDGLRYRAAG
jgi:heat shock protein HslJ